MTYTNGVFQCSWCENVFRADGATKVHKDHVKNYIEEKDNNHSPPPRHFFGKKCILCVLCQARNDKQCKRLWPNHYVK